MRNRFFVIILATLVFSAIGINVVHVYFFKSQRLKLIDKLITDSSEILRTSNDFLESVKFPERIDDTISKVLKGTKIGKIFVIRDIRSNIIFESVNVSLLETKLPTQPGWAAIETENEYVRMRTVSLPTKPPTVLQVGLVLDRNFINWEILDNRVINFITAIILTLFIASAALTLVLLSPLRILNSHLKGATSNLTNLKDVKPLPLPLTSYAHGFWARSDEFSGLINTVQKLIDRINLNYKLTRSWTLQMAHELKTPLAIMRAGTEAQVKTGKITPAYSSEVINEVEQMSNIINDFLDWAELENSQLQKDLHALKMGNVARSITARLERLNPSRIQLQVRSDFSVFANPVHLDQLVTNLVTNSLKFSPVDKPVELVVGANCFTVKDFGAGIPTEVLERLGEPFNVGTGEDQRHTGNGLGLAWVSTVVKLYQWQFEIKSGQTGTEAILQFPEQEA